MYMLYGPTIPTCLVKLAWGFTEPKEGGLQHTAQYGDRAANIKAGRAEMVNLH